MDAVRLLLDHDVPVDDKDSVRRRISLACHVNVFCVGERQGLRAGLVVTDCTFALGGWHKALQWLGSCGLPAEAGAVPFWRKPCFQICLCSVFGLFLARTVTGK